MAEETQVLTAEQKTATLLTVDMFKESRPNMVSFSNEEIQECINTSIDMLDALCGGLILQVCDYNIVDDRTTLDTTNDLYRNDFELKQITRAFIIQTQYTLNLGNDFSVGSSSMSSGGLNGSFQRPIDRDIYAPGVKEALRLARVYVYQSFGLDKKKNQELVNINDLVTREVADNRYLQKYQANGEVGSIAQLDNNKMVTFVSPSDVSFNITQAKTIYDSQDSTYKQIEEIPNLGWVAGAKKNIITPEEVEEKITQRLKNELNLQYPLFYAGEILTFENDNAYQLFKQKSGTTDDDFTNLYVDGSTWIYKQVGSDITKNGFGKIDLTGNESFQTLEDVVGNIKTEAEDVNVRLTDLENQAVKITGNQMVNGEKKFADLNIKRVTGKMPYITFLGTNDEKVALVGYTSYVNFQNNNNTFMFAGPKNINVPNFDSTASDFGDNSLITKKYVEDQVTTATTTLLDDSKAYTDTQIQAIKKVYALAGEVKMFSSKADFDTLLGRLKDVNGAELVYDVNYSFFENGRYLRHNENSFVGGTLQIAREQLPNVMYSFITRLTLQERNTIWPVDNTVTTVIYDGGQDQVSASTPNNNKVTEKVSWYMNGGVNQQNFEPIYQTIFIVKFLTDIYLGE